MVRLLVALIAAFPLIAHAQKSIERPQLPAGSDPNDPASYVRLGESLIKDKPDKAEAAFYWASRLAPGASEILYARWAARLLSKPSRLEQAMTRSQRTPSKEMLAMDSLRFQSFLGQPFLYG